MELFLQFSNDSKYRSWVMTFSLKSKISHSFSMRRASKLPPLAATWIMEFLMSILWPICMHYQFGRYLLAFRITNHVKLKATLIFLAFLACWNLIKLVAASFYQQNHAFTSMQMICSHISLNITQSVVIFTATNESKYLLQLIFFIQHKTMELHARRYCITLPDFNSFKQ